MTRGTAFISSFSAMSQQLPKRCRLVSFSSLRSGHRGLSILRNKVRCGFNRSDSQWLVTHRTVAARRRWSQYHVACRASAAYSTNTERASVMDDRHTAEVLVDESLHQWLLQLLTYQEPHRWTITAHNLENMEKSGNLKVVRGKSGKMCDRHKTNTNRVL